jgi:hypothetical protein
MKTIITPAMAADLLERNDKNRNISERQVIYLTEEILNDRFIFNGESIIVAKNGALLDGQHRLMAVIRANKPIESILIKDVPNEAQKTIDVGMSRSSANVLSMEGVKNASAMAAGIRLIVTGLSRATKKNGGRVSSSKILEVYRKEEALLYQMLHFTITLYHTSSKVISAGQAFAYLYLFSLEDRQAKQFIKEIYTGNQVGLSNAAILLRNKLINDKISRKKMTGTDKKNLIITAWRKYLRGEITERLNANDEELDLIQYGVPSTLQPKDFDREDDN